MCSTDDCPLRHNCYRAMAQPTPRKQSWMRFNFVTDDEGTSCESFIRLRPPTQIRTYSATDKIPVLEKKVN
jgi:hypothetical protein